MLEIFIDADACPVKAEVYRVAERYGLLVTLVTNKWMRAPVKQWVKLVVVERNLDAADDWIAEKVDVDDIVVTADIPLAARCLEKGALVLGNTGHPFTEDNIGDAMATRDLMSELREIGNITGGPPPFSKRDRSRFLQKLDEMIQAVRRRARG
ncbi:MAG: YaiI/YqxD family protein [Deltaproteobacteria bacterium]|nr:YaiI/YqxD family protein [Deltaproteobacteria bacterium]